MADRFPGEIWIGGRLELALAESLCEAIKLQQVALDWGDGPFAPQSADDLLAVRDELGESLVLRLCDDEAAFGEFHELERFLIANEIPFTRRSDGKYEFDPELVDYRPGHEPRYLKTDHGGNPVILVEQVFPIAAKLTRIERQLAKGELADAKRAVETASRTLRKVLPARLPPLPSFEFAPASDDPPTSP